MLRFGQNQGCPAALPQRVYLETSIVKNVIAVQNLLFYYRNNIMLLKTGVIREGISMKIFIFVILFSGTLFADMSMHEKLSDLPDDRPRIRRSTRADRGALAMTWVVGKIVAKAARAPAPRLTRSFPIADPGIYTVV